MIGNVSVSYSYGNVQKLRMLKIYSFFLRLSHALHILRPIHRHTVMHVSTIFLSEVESLWSYMALITKYVTLKIAHRPTATISPLLNLCETRSESGSDIWHRGED